MAVGLLRAARGAAAQRTASRAGAEDDHARRGACPPTMAPIDFTFYTGTQFPAEYRGGAFITLHGSWNRSQRVGYKVVYVPFANGRPSGPREDFLTGWMVAPARRDVWGRPVGVVMLADGSLLVSDDGGNKIWRVAYQAGEPSRFGPLEDRRESTSGQIAVAEFGLRVIGQIAFELLPVLVVHANLLAVGAHRQQASQLLDVGERLLELGEPPRHALLQRHDPHPHLGTRLQFGRIERLDDVVVGASLETRGDIGRLRRARSPSRCRGAETPAGAARGGTGRGRRCRASGDRESARSARFAPARSATRRGHPPRG